jgi:hypothetical protein
MAIIKGTNGLSINVQHDYITLRTPNGNFTTSWNGAKATGKLAKEAFETIDKYVQEKMKTSTAGDAMEYLLDTKILSSLWKGWNQEIKPNLFILNDNVNFNEPLFIKKYPKGGVVVKVSKKTVYIRLTGTTDVIGFDYQTLVKI